MLSLCDLDGYSCSKECSQKQSEDEARVFTFHCFKIIPDSEPDGDPVVKNGLALCKIHHAAYNRGVLGITPDFEVSIREDVLIEKDGPMLKHGLVEMHGVKLFLPRSKSDWPDQERLERRFISFLDSK